MAKNTAQYTYLIKDRYTGPIKKITGSTKKFTKQTEHAVKVVKSLHTRLKSFGKSAVAVGQKLSRRLTLPLAAIGTVGVVAFARLEKGLINVNNLLTRPELAQFDGDLKTLQSNAIRAGFSIDDTNKSLFDTVSALGASKRGFNAFAVAQKLAMGGNADLGVAVDGLSTLMSVYESDNVTATQAANALFSAQVKGKTTVAALSAGMGNVASTAKMAGVDMNTMLASLSAMTLGGVKTDDAVTALNASLLAIAKPQDNAKKLMDRMGISWGVAAIKAKGLPSIFKEIADASEKFGEQKVMEAIPERRALKAIAALVGGGKLDKIDEIIAKIEKGGDLDRAVKEMQGSLSWQFARTRGEFTSMLSEFVELFAPALKGILKFMGALIRSFSLMPKPMKYFVAGLLILAAIIPPLLITFGAMAFALSSIIAVLPAVSAGLAIMGLGVTSIVWPVLLAVAAFTAWAYALQQVIANWETLSAPGFFKDLGGWIMGNDPLAGLAGGGGSDMANDKAAGRKKESMMEIGGRIVVETLNPAARVKGIISNLQTGYNFMSGMNE